MAIMGVHINGGGQNSISTSLGEELAKSIWGDPELEMKLALQRQEYENTAWQRRKWDAEIAANQAATEKLAAEAADQAYQTRARQNAAGIIADQQAGLLEPPVPVEISPAHTELPATVDLDTPYGRYAGGGNIGEELPMKPGVPEVAIPQDPNTPFGIMQLGEGAGISLPAVGGFGSPERPDMPVPIEVPAEMGVPPDKQAAYERDVAAIRARVKAAMAMGQSATDIAKGMGISEGAVRMLSSDPQQRELGTTLYTGNAPTGGAGSGGFNEAEQKLRKEYFDRKEVQRFDIIQSRYRSALKNAAMGGGVGDTGLIYDVIKMLDPTSTVMGGEQVTAANAPGLTPQYIAYFNGLLNATGDKFTPGGREQFLQMAKNIYEGGIQDVQGVNDYYTNLAKQNGLKPENVIYPIHDAPADSPGALPTGITEDMVQRVMQNNPGYDRLKAIKLIVDRLTQNAGGQ